MLNPFIAHKVVRLYSENNCLEAQNIRRLAYNHPDAASVALSSLRFSLPGRSIDQFNRSFDISIVAVCARLANPVGIPCAGCTCIYLDFWKSRGVLCGLALRGWCRPGCPIELNRITQLPDSTTGIRRTIHLHGCVMWVYVCDAFSCIPPPPKTVESTNRMLPTRPRRWASAALWAVVAS